MTALDMDELDLGVEFEDEDVLDSEMTAIFDLSRTDPNTTTTKAAENFQKKFVLLFCDQN